MREIYKRYSRVILSLYLLLSPLAPHTASCEEIVNSARELSLKDSITLAFLNNKPIQIQAEAIDMAKAGINHKTHRLPGDFGDDRCLGRTAGVHIRNCGVCGGLWP